MSAYMQRQHDLSALHSGLNAASKEFTAICKSGNVFGPEMKAAAEKHKLALAQYRSFLTSKPKS